ncbi:acyl-CoA dehydrogenase [Streptomyces axinellae]|uniref:Acyl-CoA dehydrogenase n=1 Tax=Streptomyces axinellae TaxID=552788 RepID=A0ABN3Q3T4_9ACTN
MTDPFGVGGYAEGPYPEGPQVAPVAAAAHWERIARELADDLAVDAPEREGAGRPPVEEMARVRESGLLAALTPPAPTTPSSPSAPVPTSAPVPMSAGTSEDISEGGHGGMTWPFAFRIVRLLAGADSSVAELLGRHYVLSWSGRLLLPAERGLAWEARTVGKGKLLTGEIAAPVGTDSDTDAATATATGGRAAGEGLTVTTDDRGYTLSGRSTLVPGALVADRVLVSARRAGTGASRAVVLVDPADPAVTLDPVDQLLGQRLSGTGTLTFDHLHVSDGQFGDNQVLSSVTGDEHLTPPVTTLLPLALRLMTAHVVLGLAEGALAEARDATLITAHTRSTARRRHDPDTPAADPDPDLLHVYGELAAAAHVAATVVSHARGALAEGVRRGWALDAEECARIGVSVTTAEATAGESALHITARVLELADTAGLDRFWRNTRTLTTRRSPARRLRAIGEHFLYAARSVPALGA